MSDETTLLHCPFCGGEAETFNPFDNADGTWCVLCSECAAATGFEQTEAEAIAAWNTRSPVEYDGWFYLPKPKESIVQYGEQRTEKTEYGYKVTQPVEVIENAIRSWGDELGEYIMKRICEAWSTRATHGTLTAEQVREAVMSADRWEKPMGNTGLTNAHLIIRDDGWQAIADELNAELGSGTCRITASATDGLCSDNPHQYFELSCGHSFTLDELGAPVACAVCGKAVER